LDLFSVVLHEAGHVFGLDESSDPTSPMFGEYEDNTVLTAEDIGRLQDLYGVRTPDSFEGSTGNDDIPHAAKLENASGSGSGVREADGDLMSLTDTDYYRLDFPGNTDQLTVRLEMQGLSLLQGRLSVVDSLGNVVATAVADKPGQDLQLVVHGGAGHGH